MKIQKNIDVLFIVGIYLYFLFENLLKFNFQIFDKIAISEILIAVIFLDIILNFFKKRVIRKSSAKILFFLMLFFITGLLGNYFSGNIVSPSLIIRDFLSMFRWLIAFLFVNNFNETKKDVFFITIQKISQKIVIVFFFLAVFNIIFDFIPSGDVRNGVVIQTLFFSHSTYLATVIIISLLTILFYKSNEQENKSTMSYMVMSIVLIVLTGRYKAIIFGIVICCIYLFKILKIKVNLLLLATLAILMLFIFKDVLITRLFSSETSARFILYKNGFKLFEQYFPVGAGFGTYGSYASVTDYSLEYYQLGMNKIYGFSPENSNYITDGFYPMLIGQFGFLGIVSFWLIIKNTIKNKEKNLYLIMLLLFVFISMLTENYLSTSFGVVSFVLIGMSKQKEGLK